MLGVSPHWEKGRTRPGWRAPVVGRASVLQALLRDRQAQRGWLGPGDVINTWPLPRLREFLRKDHRQRGAHGIRPEPPA